MENTRQDEPFKDTTPAAPIESVPESSSAPQESEAPFDDPTSLDEDDQVIEGEEEPPVSNGEDPGSPGDDTDVPNSAAPERHSIESVQADEEDQRGDGV